MHKNVIVCDGCGKEESQTVPSFTGTQDEVREQLRDHLRKRRVWICVYLEGKSSVHFCEMECLNGLLPELLRQTAEARQKDPFGGQVLLTGPSCSS
jgi:hypothetical protein